MLTTEKLQELVQEIVPEQYKPGANKNDAGWPIITDIVYADEKRGIDYYVEKFIPDIDDPNTVKAICLNWGELYKRAKLDNKHNSKNHRWNK